MKSIFLTVALFSATLSVYAQRVNPVQIGPNNDQTTHILKVLGENSDGIFYMAGKGDDVYVQRYNAASLSLEHNSKIEIPEIDGTKLEMEEMFLVDQNIILFATGYNAASKTYVTYSFVIDNLGTIVSDGQLVFKMEVEKKSRSGSVEYRMSEDRSRVLIYNRSYLKSQELNRYSFILLNTKGEIETEKFFEVKNAEKGESIEILNFSIDYNYDIHTCISKSIYNKAAKENQQEFEIVSYKRKDNYEATSTKISLTENKLISSMIVAPKKDGSLAVGGFYVPLIKGKRATGIEGTFYTTIDNSGNAGNVNYEAFSDNLKKQIISDRQTEKGTDIPLTYRMRQVYVDNMDNITFLAEDFYVTQSQQSGNTYYYGYIMVIKMNSEGKIEWETVVNKRQIFQEIKVGLGITSGAGVLTLGVTGYLQLNSDKNSYLSFEANYVNGSLFIIYNDDIKNADAEIGKKRNALNSPLKGVPFSATIDSNGNLSYALEKELGDEETTMRPRYSLIEGDKIYFITAKRSIEKVGVGKIN